MSTENHTVSAFCDDVLGTHDGVELGRLIAAKEIKASEAIEAAIARAQKVNPQLNAIATETFGEAVAGAHRAQSGPFAGVPSFIKDTDNVEGVPTKFGSRAVSDKPAKSSSPFVEQYLATGLISLGKSTLPEFGLTGTTESIANGPTHNPWRLGYSTGGSSGGSAALVAAGVVPLAHANDGGGSIRIPASCCGLVGLKPSRDRLVPFEGSDRMPLNLVNQGLVSRTVRDTAVFYAAAEDHFRNPDLPRLGLVEGPGKARLRIGLYTDLPDHTQCDSEASAAVLDAGKLCETLGHRVEEISAPFSVQVSEDFLVYWGFLAFGLDRLGKLLYGPDFDRKKLEPLTHGLSRHFQKNLLRSPFSLRRLRKFAAEYDRTFEKYDILLCPVAAHAPPKHGLISPEVPYEINVQRLGRFLPFTSTQNIAGAPGISLPLGRSRLGLPIGVQFAAPAGHDRRLLELAFELEAAKPWPLVGQA